MDNLPLISIVLPCFNGEKFLAKAIESCISQSYRNWELIIVNDCSTDSSLNIAKKYATQDSRIRIINNTENLKLPASLNRGFSIADGKYFTWTSDDNILHSNMLEEMCSCLESNPKVGFIVSDQLIINTAGDIIEEMHVPDDIQNLLVLNNYVGASFMYRSDLAKEIGPYREDLFLVEDYEYWLRISCHCEMMHLGKILYSYRKHERSLTETRKKEVAQRLAEMRLEYYPEIKTRLRNKPYYLSLFYNRIIDNLTSNKQRIKYFKLFAKDLPWHFGIKYIFIHLPHRMWKRIFKIN